MSKVVCVTGMHRSGTSLLASWLFEQGLKLDSGGFVGSSVGNKKGHFEDEEIMRFQADLIKNARFKSKGWVVKRPIQVNGFDEGVQEILKKREAMPQWGWKDPRTVLLLNEWNKTIKDLKFVFIWREADGVINSLIKRKKKSKHPLDQISLINCYKCWVHYNRTILDFYKQNPTDCVLINLDDFLNHDKKVFEFLKDEFELHLIFKPLNSLVENSMFSEKSTNWIRKIYNVFFKTQQLEKELLKFSLKV